MGGTRVAVTTRQHPDLSGPTNEMYLKDKNADGGDGAIGVRVNEPGYYELKRLRVFARLLDLRC